MIETPVRDFYGTILGILEENVEPDGSRKVTARDFPSRQILGFYHSSRNVTTDFFGRMLHTGDGTVALIMNQKK